MSGPLSIGEVLRRSTAYLAERGSPSPRLDADLLLAHALGIERIQLYTDSERPLTPPELDRARALVGRRGRREPLAYLTGQRAFRRLRLAVGPGVLVPRPETEVLVEWALAVAQDGGSLLDWGTGSGAVALALADEGPALRVTALDRSEEALAVARANDDAGRVEWLLSDGFAAVAGRRFDVIAANPPYLSPVRPGGGPPGAALRARGRPGGRSERAGGHRADRRRGARAPGARRVAADGGGRRPGGRGRGHAHGRRARGRHPPRRPRGRGAGGGRTPGLSDDVAAARAALRAGGVALVPTDTVYGLAAALDVPAGVDALYALKGRPRAQPCQVLLFAPALLAEALDALDARTRAAAAALLPGPATCLVADPAGRYAAAAGEAAGTVGLRAPRMSGALLELDIPLVATSANHPGGPDPGPGRGRARRPAGRERRDRRRRRCPAPRRRSSTCAPSRGAARPCWCAPAPIPRGSRGRWPRSARRSSVRGRGVPS